MKNFLKTRFLNRPPRVWVVRRKILGHIYPVQKKFHLIFSWQKSICGFQVLQPSRRQKGDTCAYHSGILALEYRKRISVARSSQFRYLFKRTSYRRPTMEEMIGNDKDQRNVRKYPFYMRIKQRVYLNFTRDGQRKKQLAFLHFPRLSVHKAIDYVKDFITPGWKKKGALNVPFVFRHAKIKGIPLDKFYNEDGCDKNWRFKQRAFLKNWDFIYCQRDPTTLKMTEKETRKVEKWIIKRYMADGPIVGSLMCNRQFEKDFYSDLGFCKYERYRVVNKKGEEAVIGHYVVIIGHGICTWKARVKGSLRRIKKYFFLVQDSNGERRGPLRMDYALSSLMHFINYWPLHSEFHTLLSWFTSTSMSAIVPSS